MSLLKMNSKLLTSHYLVGNPFPASLSICNPKKHDFMTADGVCTLVDIQSSCFQMGTKGPEPCSVQC